MAAAAAEAELQRLLRALEGGLPSERGAALDGIAALLEAAGAAGASAATVQALVALQALPRELLARPRLIRALFSLRASRDPNSADILAFGFACYLISNLLKHDASVFAACPDAAAFADSLADAAGALLTVRRDRATPRQLPGIDSASLPHILGPPLAGQDPTSSLDRAHAAGALRVLAALAEFAPARSSLRARLAACRARMLPALIGAIAAAGVAPRRGPRDLATDIAACASLSALIACLEQCTPSSAAKRAAADALLAARPGLLQALERLPDWREARARPLLGQTVAAEMTMLVLELCGALAAAGAHQQVLSSRHLMASLLQILSSGEPSNELACACSELGRIIVASTGSEAPEDQPPARAAALYRLVGPEAVRALVAAVCTLGEAALDPAGTQLRLSGTLPVAMITALGALEVILQSEPAALGPLAAAAKQAAAFMPLLARVATPPAAAGGGGEGSRGAAGGGLPVFAAMGLAEGGAAIPAWERVACAMALIQNICEHQESTGDSQALRATLATPALADAVGGAIAAGGGPDWVASKVFTCASSIVQVASSPSAGAAGVAFCRAVVAAAPRAPAVIAAAVAAVERRGEGQVGGGGGSGVLLLEGLARDIAAGVMPRDWGEAMAWLKPLGEQLAALQCEQEAATAAAAAAAAAAPAGAPTAAQQVCSVCGAAAAPGERLFRCARCRAPGLYYCGRRCQAADWRAHKPACTAGSAGRG
ncbi:hypothetical protein Rsub_00069 [Raphidocelis subcapitata]|uniref:MYND-type domain-containing protein n=1 Tax=Raphidocelis subcapitata TaxID=307507 RepID=A0A2V0NJG3_9CHLO|nr:hypothetical protein Rsub_00069 [Raphidocelis subcapitata]|eukprot:GBF87358.1 hypothetical protein Rsub_00069 [Raphidocelis subcapitata]